MTIKGYLGKYLSVTNEKDAFFGSSSVGVNELWIIYPLSTGRVVIKHIKSK